MRRTSISVTIREPVYTRLTLRLLEYIAKDHTPKVYQSAQQLRGEVLQHQEPVPVQPTTDQFRIYLRIPKSLQGGPKPPKSCDTLTLLLRRDALPPKKNSNFQDVVKFPSRRREFQIVEGFQFGILNFNHFKSIFVHFFFFLGAFVSLEFSNVFKFRALR